MRYYWSGFAVTSPALWIGGLETNKHQGGARGTRCGFLGGLGLFCYGQSRGTTFDGYHLQCDSLEPPTGLREYFSPLVQSIRNTVPES